MAFNPPAAFYRNIISVSLNNNLHVTSADSKRLVYITSDGRVGFGFNLHLSNYQIQESDYLFRIPFTYAPQNDTIVPCIIIFNNQNGSHNTIPLLIKSNGYVSIKNGYNPMNILQADLLLRGVTYDMNQAYYG